MAQGRRLSTAPQRVENFSRYRRTAIMSQFFFFAESTRDRREPLKDGQGTIAVEEPLKGGQGPVPMDKSKPAQRAEFVTKQVGTMVIGSDTLVAGSPPPGAEFVTKQVGTMVIG